MFGDFSWIYTYYHFNADSCAGFLSQLAEDAYSRQTHAYYRGTVWFTQPPPRITRG